MGLWTHGAQRQVIREAMPHCSGLDSTAKTKTAVPEPVGGHLGNGHKELALAASLTTSLSCSHLRPKGMRVSMARVARAGEGYVPAAQPRRMPERALGYYSLAEGGGWASAPRQHIGQGDATR